MTRSQIVAGQPNWLHASHVDRDCEGWCGGLIHAGDEFAHLPDPDGGDGRLLCVSCGVDAQEAAA